MKLSNQKKSWYPIKCFIIGLSVLSISYCTSPSKAKNPVKVNPSTVVDTVKIKNNSSPNHSENQAKLDSLKKVAAKEKRKK